MEARGALPGARDGPLVALAFKLEEGRFGQLTYMRVYSGVVRKGDVVTNVATGKRVKVRAALLGPPALPDRAAPARQGVRAGRCRHAGCAGQPQPVHNLRRVAPQGSAAAGLTPITQSGRLRAWHRLATHHAWSQGSVLLECAQQLQG